MTGTATTSKPPTDRLAQGEERLRQAEADLAMLEESRRDRRAEFEDARRAGADMVDLSRINTALSTIEKLIADQRGDVATARSQVDKLRVDAERAEQLAAVHAAQTELKALHEGFGDALAVAVASVAAAFEPVRRARARWIEARERAGRALEQAGVPLNPASSGQRDTLLQSLEALGVSRHVFLSAPDAKAPPLIAGFGSGGHFPVPEPLEAAARAAGLRAPGHPREMTTEGFLKLAAYVATHALEESGRP